MPAERQPVDQLGDDLVPESIVEGLGQFCCNRHGSSTRSWPHATTYARQDSHRKSAGPRGIHASGVAAPNAFGYCSHVDHKVGSSSWPLPAPESCEKLGEEAKGLKVLENAPRDGDVFLLYSPMAKGFVHMGIVLSVDDVFPVASGQRYRCTTLEGKTIADGPESGCTAVRRYRVFGAKDQFIRWVDLDGYIRKVA